MSPTLSALLALQKVDSAAEALKKRLADLPGAERAIDAALVARQAEVDGIKARVADNHTARRALEKDVAAVDTRLARFDDHKAAVKTNQEYTALLHEIATAKSEKTAIEDRVLALMEEGEALAAALKTSEQALKSEQVEAVQARAALADERTRDEQELARLADERTREAREVTPALFAKYEQLLKQRRGIGVARMSGDICDACHVRLRPHVAQMVRRNDEIVQCDSCQRILYYDPPPPGTAA